MTVDPTDQDRLLIERLSVVLPSGRRILNDVSLTVSTGEVVVVLGESGAGKSTLADVLFGLISERMPTAKVTAERLGADEERMALILQQGSLFDHLSLSDNIRFAARRSRRTKLTGHQVGQLLDQVGYQGGHDDVTRLSGGEERRVAVARGLATDPRFIFFDEPTAGLDPANVLRIAGLIRQVCSQRGTGAIVVTHSPLLAAVVGDRLLFLDRRDGSVTPLIEDWPGPAGSEEDEEVLAARRQMVEQALVARIERGGVEPTAPGDSTPAAIRPGGLTRLADAVAAPGRLIANLLATFWSLPASLRHFRDFAQIAWRATRLTGYTGLAFHILVGAILSTTFLSIAFAAASLVSPELILRNLRGDFILALTPPLCGFLFSARSGSALTAWLGGMTLRRQGDALKSLGVPVDQYLRAPAFVGTFLGFLLTTVAFGASMYLAATLTATGFGVAEAGAILAETTSSFERQFLQKSLLYAVVIPAVGTHMGLTVKRTSQDVAQGITRSIIICTLAIVTAELFFAIDLQG
ncbi:MAG: ATP-binding cassette domain-containing protein [Bradymonadales bacterium]|nr:ATP-binding cassette domain-containing protein [Bradymonadales bacterium]